jgi:ABC-type transport system involved in multi-copper enzyme maturation permease subunit
MSVLPVIVRELRAQSRQALTYWLRIIGGVAVAGAIAMALFAMGTIKGNSRGAFAISNTIQTFGTTLFGKMNLFIFLAIWLFVPLTTADAVSRERREGTLALLYLTELRSLGIVVGKVFVHMLRSVSLFLTMAPWLLLPLVFGGVGLRDIGMALMLNFTSVLLAQAAGLLASTIPRDWLKSVILAELFALILLLTMLNLHGAILRHVVRAGAPIGLTPGTPTFWNSGLADLYYFFDTGMDRGGILTRTSQLLEFTTNGNFLEPQGFYGRFGWISAGTHWQQIWTRLTPAGPAFWFLGVAGLVGVAALVLVAATWLGAWRVEKSWQDAPAQILTAEFKRKFLSPRFRVQSLSRNLSRALTANPIGWLQHYSPAARMVKWAWCLLIIVVEIIFSANSSDLYAAQAGLGLVLLLGLTFSATGSFRDELETGAFELLLVTPLRERQIIVGRLRGLWRQFLPAILIYGAGSIYLTSGWSDREYSKGAWVALARTLTAFCALPLIGLYFSVQRWNFFAAWLAACVIGLLPAALGRIFDVPDTWMIPFQLGIALAAAVLLERRLRNREFLQKRS